MPPDAGPAPPGAPVGAAPREVACVPARTPRDVIAPRPLPVRPGCSPGRAGAAPGQGRGCAAGGRRGAGPRRGETRVGGAAGGRTGEPKARFAAGGAGRSRWPGVCPCGLAGPSGEIAVPESQLNGVMGFKV